jgi:hypothetical protein
MRANITKAKEKLTIHPPHDTASITAACQRAYRVWSIGKDFRTSLSWLLTRYHRSSKKMKIINCKLPESEAMPRKYPPGMVVFERKPRVDRAGLLGAPKGPQSMHASPLRDPFFFINRRV